MGICYHNVRMNLRATSDAQARTSTLKGQGWTYLPARNAWNDNCT